MTAVFLTIDTELSWGKHASGLPPETVVERSLEPAGVGVSHQLALLADHGLKATFFVDPMPARIYGVDLFRRLVDTILSAGQEVQLHLHPNWALAKLDDRSACASFELIDHDAYEQRELIDIARNLLLDAGAPPPVAFRAGSYSANDDTLAALTALGFTYDSSHNGSEHPWPSAIDLPVRQIAPVVRCGLIEVPVTLIEDVPGRLRHFQICALSTAEMRAALDHAAQDGHVAVTIVGHSFELASRAGTRVNGVHASRFASLCRMLAERSDTLPTVHFADRPALALDRDDVPLGPNRWRAGLRQAQQLWSNLIEERAA